VLGRGVVVEAGEAPPAAWAGAPRVVVDEAVLVDPAPTVAVLHQAWAERRPVVVERAVSTERLRAPATCDLPPYALSPAFDLSLERLFFLVWANNYEQRADQLVWWHARKAARRFEAAGVTLGGPADLLLADGTPAWVDGGPGWATAPGEGTVLLERGNVEAGSLRPVGSAPPAAELAPDQLAAVAHRGGPARVIAPAGSGKTRVLTERLRHLVADVGVHPSTVTVVAYNTKAADELRTRCADVLGPEGPSVRTLNSLGLWLCNRFGGQGRLAVLGEMEARDVVESLFEIRHRANTDTVVPYLEALATIRLGLVAPEVAEERHPDATGIGQGFERYRTALAEAGAVDFDEQIYRAIEILLTDPVARAEAQAGCRHLLVDEFQDLNPAHLLLLRLLASPGLDTFGVGDDDQVLYGYAGATPEYLIDFDRYFPGADHHALEVNYRCPPAVVTAADRLLSCNVERVAKTIRPAPGRPDDPAELVVTRAPGEQLAALAAGQVAQWRDQGTGLDQMAVLARVNSALLPVLVALSEAGIACTSTLNARVLARTGVRTAFAYLRIGADPERISRRDVEDTVRRPSRGLAPNVVAMLAERPHTSVADIRRLAGRLTGRDGPKVAAYAADLDRVARACRQGTVAALRAVRLEVKLGETMDVLDGSREEPDRSTHHDDLLALEAVAAFHGEVATFERWLRGVLDRPRPDGPSVELSTVHRIKGREWDRVVLYGASAGLFPHRLAEDEEGERRVFHVGLTRARRQALVLADAEAPSVFLDEMAGRRRPAPRRAPAAPPAARPAGPVGAVPAEIGQVVETGGLQGPIVAFTEEGAVLAIGRSTMAVAFGADVRRDGRVGPLGRPVAGPPPAAAETRAPAVEATEASVPLRAWRTGVARRQGMPPYLVLSDRHLEGIVAAAPSTLAQLARCPGIGPAKLERWGDEILAVLAGADPDPEPEPAG